MKKVLFLFGSIIFGYIGLTGVAVSINPSLNVPSEFSFFMGIIGGIGLFIMRFFWKKFKEQIKKDSINIEKNEE